MAASLSTTEGWWFARQTGVRHIVPSAGRGLPYRDDATAYCGAVYRSIGADRWSVNTQGLVEVCTVPLEERDEVLVPVGAHRPGWVQTRRFCKLCVKKAEADGRPYGG